MDNRRSFLAKLGVAAVGAGIPALSSSCQETIDTDEHVVLSTWNNQEANKEAYRYLSDNQAIDAVEKGINTVERNPDDTSVGYGGAPDRDGNVTLDACIMDDLLNCGSVCYLKNYMHPISVARKVMEETPHVILAGEGAAQFAQSQGFKSENLLTPNSKANWEKWLEKKEYKPIVNIEDHDTIGMIVREKGGRLAGGCSTSGLAYKMQGRVGDSPIIGAGLYVDGAVGAATATGLGELVLKTLSSFLVVELMRMGKSPQEACELSIKRITEKIDYQDVQVGLIALNRQGEYGAYSIQPGFKYSLTKNGQTTVNESLSYIR